MTTQVNFDSIGGGSLGDYTQFKQGTFTTIYNKSNPTVVNDVGFTPKYIVCIPRTSPTSGKYPIYLYTDYLPFVSFYQAYNNCPPTTSSDVYSSYGGKIVLSGASATTNNGWGGIIEVNSTGFKLAYTDNTTVWDYYAYG